MYSIFLVLFLHSFRIDTTHSEIQQLYFKSVFKHLNSEQLLILQTTTNAIFQAFLSHFCFLYVKVTYTPSFPSKK